MSDTIVLDGSCKLLNNLDGSCDLDSMLDGSCDLESMLDGCVMSVLAVSHSDYYTGDYTVIPQAHKAVVLPTNGLMMSDDVAVKKVPYYETTNEHGNTVYIASETEVN